jgi:hypothetical protein
VCAQHTAATDHVQKIVTKGSINKNDQDSGASSIYPFLSLCGFCRRRQSRREKHSSPSNSYFATSFSCTAAALIFLPFEDLFIYLCTLESDALSNFFNPLCDI